MSFVPGKNSSNGINVSDGIGSKYIFFGDEWNGSVVSFKAFLKTISYDLAKEIEENSSTEKGSYDFKAKSGTMAIKFGFSVVASSLSEAKQNLAKISQLQTSIRFQKTQGLFDGKKPRQLVYFSNLINNGRADNWISVKKETTYLTDLRKIGLICTIGEVKYEPDVSFGFFSSDDGLFPKTFDVNLTLNPDTTARKIGDSSKIFLQPFNINGQYNNSDSAFFPFLVKTRHSVKQHEAGDFLRYAGDFDYTSTGISDKEANSSGDSKIFISMPIDPSDYKGWEDKDSSPISFTVNAEVPRYVVFESFIESFSRTFKTNFTSTTDPDGALTQTIDSNATNAAVDYSLSFNVPSGSLSDAKKNAAKIQLLMRMFYKKQNIGAKNAKLLSGLKVYCRGILQNGNEGSDNTTTISKMYKRAMFLTLKSLTVDIDVNFGFFESSGKYYPKLYKISIDVSDDEIDNYLKLDENGNYEEVGKSFSGQPWDNVGSTPSNRQKLLANIKYWEPE